MNMRRGIFSVMILLMAALACVVPGQPAVTPLSQPTPDTRLGTMVAEKVAFALEQTALAVPTDTPPPTTTLSPEPTATSALRMPLPGSILTVQDDGSTLFVDENAGYQIVIPAGWLAVRLNEQEFQQALELADPNIQNALSGIQNQDPSTFRLLALDVMEGHIQNGVVTNVNFIWDPNAAYSFESTDDLQKLADELPASVDGLTVSSVNIIVPPSGSLYGEIQSEIGGYNSSGEQVTMHQRMTLFNLRKGMLVITFTTESGFSETILPMFVEMLESLLIETE